MAIGVSVRNRNGSTSSVSSSGGVARTYSSSRSSSMPQNTAMRGAIARRSSVGSDNKIYGTGGTGKDYVYNPATGNVMVNGNVVRPGDKNYNATVGAMKNDGFDFNPSKPNKKPSSSSGSSSSSSSSSSKPNSSSSSSSSGSVSSAPSGTVSGNTPNSPRPTLTPYETSDKNKQHYQNNTSTHLMKATAKLDPNDKRMTVDQHGNWVSDQFGKDAGGTFVLKGGDPNKKVYMNENNKQHFADNYGGTGGFFYDENNQVTYRNKEQEQEYMKKQGIYSDEQIANATGTEAMRTDKYYNIFGDKNKFTPGNNEKMDKFIAEKYKGMTPEQLQAYKANTDSMLERNAISSIDGTMVNDESYNYAPIAFAPQEMQENLSFMLYDEMRKAGGIQNFEGMSTLALDSALNKAGLSGMFDINQVQEPYMLEQEIQRIAQMQGDSAELVIDGKVIMDALVENGALKEGYTYNQETGEIGVDPQYVQVGDILMDKGEAMRWYGNQEGHSVQRARNENVTGMMQEEPLEWRAKYNPESMTDEMKADLEMERQIKAELEQLTLQLGMLDEQMGMGDGIPMVLGSGVGGAGNGFGNGSGKNTNNGFGFGYGNGGNSEFNGVTGGGRSAVYGTSQNYTQANKQLLNAIGRRM